MSNFSEQVHITIDEFTQTVVYYDLELSQIMMDHHYFSFVWQYTGKAVIKPADQAAAVRKYEGREVIFTFKSLNGGIKLMSKGIITKLKSVDVNGSPVGLHVKGISHTVLLDDMKKSRTFLDRNLQEIALNIFAEETAGEFYQRDAIEPTYIKIFDYKPQYNETSFDFLKRLSARYGQWFYFDGMRIQLGQTKTSKVKLINGASLHEFGIETNLVSHKTSFGGYDYNTASNITASEAKTNTGSVDSFSRIILDRQASVSQPNLNIGAYTNQAQNATEIAELSKLQTASRDANSVFYTGISYLPIGVGQVFTIQDQTVEHELLAIEVIHHSQVHGNYKCEFKAIPADVAAPHYTNVNAFAIAQSQSAKVFDNNDPEGLGRIKVDFYWGAGSTKSEWMRVAQQYSGDARGIYWTPEIGDEVLVDFEGSNIDCPYVLASHYNGKAKPEFFDSKNMIKGWKLKFGQLFKFVEKVGIWLSDPSGNEIHLDEENKNINATTPETFTVRAKNIVFEATESITFKAGTNIIQEAENDINITAAGRLLENGDEKIEIIDEKITINAAEHIETAEKINMNATNGDMTFKASKTIHANSGEKSNFN
ncbi:type IV secretion protein Rhs [Flavobacterium sp. ANB]|uniref:type VI secretion system Vgr family protein n=1 Tax=unclassified Flavobacterium TaxID=196869 RepID=UPI0012B9502E|nr:MULTISPECIES: phage baseplate assembly protein V [unclassified Flavobacterium]MBF4516685.1 type IV secretion protein Rhs [Flavobacterium sp. ANB]MTD69419.1 type IV secretion protein Rhs [Flavobacterium sp. LC2016-13]